MSVVADSSVSVGHSASVTTGQGGDGLGNWMARGLKYQQPNNRLGNSRAPPPTCNIPVPRARKIIMPVSGEQPWGAKLADSLMAEPICAQGNSPGRVAVNGASGSLESTQEDMQLSNGEHGRPSDEVDDESNHDSSGISEDEDIGASLKSPKAGYKRGRKCKEKKKVGRPIAYRGDPNAPELTDQERRRIKRRIANRESARRVRHKRQEELEDMQIKMEQIQAHNSHLQQHAAHIKQQKKMLCNQLEDLEVKFEKVNVENKQLAIEIQALRQSLQLKMSALEEELDKRASEADNVALHSAFGNPQVQSAPLSPYIAAHQATIGGLAMDGKICPSVPLDWFPSLNMDDSRGLDVVHSFFDEPAGMSSCVKKETID